MGIISFVDNMASEISKAISKNGFGHGLMFNATEAARNAARGKLIGSLKGITSIMDEEAASAITKKMNAKDMSFLSDEAFTNAFKETEKAAMEAGGETIKNFNTVKKDMFKYRAADRVGSMESYARYLGREDGTLGAINSLKGYFGDPTNGSLRAKATVGMVGGTMVGTRLLSGGSLTTTASGERNIVGVPFV